MRRILFIICLIIYILSRCIIMFILPFYWFLFIYILNDNKMTFCYYNYGILKCMENCFILIIISMYLYFLILFIKSIINILYDEYWFGYCTNNKLNDSLIADKFIKNMQINKIIFDIIQHDIAAIICSYLSNMHCDLFIDD